MGWLAGLFSGGATPKAASSTPPAQKPHTHVNFLQEMLRQGSTAAAMTIINEYAAVVETLRERLESTGRLLHPESILPYPKETIRTAFVIVFEAMARDHLQSWNGVSIDIFLGVAMPLDHDFAPDKEVPEDPGQNFVAYSQRPGLEHAAAFCQRLRDIGALPQEEVRKSPP